MPYRVHWEVADDEQFRAIRLRGDAVAEPAFAHSVHVDVRGLPPGRAFCYRFFVGDAVSPVGRTRTAPRLSDEPTLLRLALASCQHFEHGYYAAYRHMLRDDLDLIVFVGDYIYEGSFGPVRVRNHPGQNPITVDEYRLRYACYRADPLLQQAHARYPWVLVWDDHEVEDNYYGDRSVYYDDRAQLRARRAAAYQAYYEHQPLPARMRPQTDGMRIFTHLAWGKLVQLMLLDTRQYRSTLPCPPNLQRAKPGCRAWTDPHASMLGIAQEHWLTHRLRHSPARWNVLAQQQLVARWDQAPGPREQLENSGWDGYPAARSRLIASLRTIANPLVLSGDAHSFWVNHLQRDFLRPEEPPVATEIVTTSISSYGGDANSLDGVTAENPHIKAANARYRGYARLDIRPQHTACDLQAMTNVEEPDSSSFTLSSWLVEGGRRGVNKA